MKFFVWVGLGGFLGGMLRVLLEWTATALGVTSAWPPTLVANVLGCLVIGWLVGRFLGRPDSGKTEPFLIIGFCGGLTTFSILSLQLMEMLQQGRLWLATGYMAAILALGLGAVVVGHAFGKSSERS